MSLTISANKLASFIAAKTPEQRRRIVRDLIRESQIQEHNYAPYYASFRSPAKRYVANGAKSTTEIQQVIEDLKKRSAVKKRRWHAIDLRVTAQAFKALIAFGPQLASMPVSFIIPPAEKAKLQFGNVIINVTPDLLIEGQRNGVPIRGSLRFYLAKESTYQLGPRRAELVSAMQYQWLAQNPRGNLLPDTSLCMVLECIQDRITFARTDANTELAIIEQGCHDLWNLWESMGRQEAAK